MDLRPCCLPDAGRPLQTETSLATWIETEVLQEGHENSSGMVLIHNGWRPTLRDGPPNLSDVSEGDVVPDAINEVVLVRVGGTRNGEYLGRVGVGETLDRTVVGDVALLLQIFEHRLPISGDLVVAVYVGKVKVLGGVSKLALLAKVDGGVEVRSSIGMRLSCDCCSCCSESDEVFPKCNSLLGTSRVGKEEISSSKPKTWLLLGNLPFCVQYLVSEDVRLAGLKSVVIQM